MKHFALALSVAVSALAITPLANADVHDAREQHRINNGFVEGQLTPMEARRLEIDQHRIERMEANARSDGYVSPWEAARIRRAHAMQDARIYRLRHNFRHE